MSDIGYTIIMNILYNSFELFFFLIFKKIEIEAISLEKYS